MVQSPFSLGSLRSRLLIRCLSVWVLPCLLGLWLAGGLPTGKVLSQSARPLAGGETTSFIRSSQAYEQPSANLTELLLKKHIQGDIAFESVFVTAPATVNPGLGPYFNNASCVRCHIGNGRGLPEKSQLLVRVSGEVKPDPAHPKNGEGYFLEDIAPGEAVFPVPGLGTQIQDQAVYGRAPEATVKIEWQELTDHFADGTPYELRYPQPLITFAEGSPLPESVAVSLRIPPPVFGLGLLEAVPEADIMALADPGDQDGDGISGRPNRVWDVEAGATALGRFGLKANQPNLIQQTAAAYANDMGVSNPLFPEQDGTYDIDLETVELAAIYTQTLAVPARVLWQDPVVQQGEALFKQAQCVACHVETLKTGSRAIAELTNQIIHPYTDLLLHDMGSGLADGRPDFAATGREWRTPPLWGIGATQAVLPYAKYLHDGRARTLEEAILWHGGEAAAAQASFKSMTVSERQALIRFLRTL